MHIYSITLYENGISVKSEKNTRKFGYFVQSSVNEFIDFLSKTIIDRATPCAYNCYVSDTSSSPNVLKFHYCLGESEFACVIVTDNEYPNNVARKIILEILSDNNDVDLKQIIEKYHKSENINKIAYIQNELDFTTTLMRNNLDTLLKRGETIENLIEKSEDLSATSKRFYKQSKKYNSCCVIQ